MASYSTIPKETEPLVAKKQSNKWIGAVAAICLFSAVLGTYSRAGVEVQAPASFSSTTGTFLWDVKLFPDGVNTLDISGDGTILAAGGIDEGQGQRRDCCWQLVGRPGLPQRFPRVIPSLHSRPRFLPQGDEGSDYLYATGSDNILSVCPASALPTALDLVPFRRAAMATTS